MNTIQSNTTTQGGKAINWSFNWGSGGYNNVTAATRDEALVKAEKLGEGWNSQGVVNLQPDEDFAETRRNDAACVGMFD